MKTLYTLLLLLSGSALPIAADTISIEPYQPERDLEAIRIILLDYPDITYEFNGYPEGTTEHSLEQPYSLTRVIRVNDQTIGFIRYETYNPTLLTFQLMPWARIFLLGIDRQYQRKGYAQKLIKYALSDFERLKCPEVSFCLKKYNIPAKSLIEKMAFICNKSEEEQMYLTELRYTYQLPVPAHDLPQGNIIQRYPRTALAIMGAGGLLWLKQHPRVAMTLAGTSALLWLAGNLFKLWRRHNRG